MVQVLYLLEVFILAHYGPPSTETPTTETTTVQCRKNSWIYSTSTYYWWLLRPTMSITIRFDRFGMKKHYSHSTTCLRWNTLVVQFELQIADVSEFCESWCLVGDTSLWVVSGWPMREGEGHLVCTHWLMSASLDCHTMSATCPVDWVGYLIHIGNGHCGGFLFWPCRNVKEVEMHGQLANCSMWLFRIITALADYRLSWKQSISAGKIYSMICVV